MTADLIRDQVARTLFEEDVPGIFPDDAWDHLSENGRNEFRRVANAVLALPIFQAVAHEALLAEANAIQSVPSTPGQMLTRSGIADSMRSRAERMLTGPDPLDAVRAEAAAVEREACALIADADGKHWVARKIREGTR